MTTMIKTVKHQLQGAIIRHMERAELRRELSTYATQAEINDLLAAFASDESPAAEEARAILNANRRPENPYPFAA